MMAKTKASARPRGDVGRIRRFGGVPTGFFTDALTRLGLDGWMDGVFPAAAGDRVAGPAVTLRMAPGRGADRSSANIYELIRTFDPGAVLVIETGGTNTSAFGENTAAHAQVQGLVGIVTDGRCRDFAEIAALAMPVFCCGPTVRLPNPLELVAHNVPISCGGAQVRPGDLVVGDADGVVVVPKAYLQAVFDEVDDIAQLEKELEKAIKTRAPIDLLQKYRPDARGGPWRDVLRFRTLRQG